MLNSYFKLLTLKKADVRPIDVNISGGYIFHLSL